MTLISRTAPPADFASDTAVASAGLAKSRSARSIGSKIFWYMAGSSQNARISRAAIVTHRAAAREPYPAPGSDFSGSASSLRRRMRSPAMSERAGLGSAANGSGRATSIAASPRRAGRGGKPGGGGREPVEPPLAEPGRELGRDAVSEHLLDQAVPGGQPAGD